MSLAVQMLEERGAAPKAVDVHRAVQRSQWDGVERRRTRKHLGFSLFHMPVTPAARRLCVGAMILAMTFVVATIGYVLAGWEWIDAIYMVTITIFGVGYGEVQPISDPAMKLFTIIVIMAGCSSGVYVIGGILQLITEGEVKRMFGEHHRGRDIEALTDHTIICGYGRVGKILAQQLEAAGEPFVVVDREQDRANQAVQDGFLAFCGDAVADETMVAAGIHRARVLTTVLPNDAINVFITLTARDLNEEIHIVARAECPSTERKLLRSGANRVVMPAAIGAVRIAQMVGDLNPNSPASQAIDENALAIDETAPATGNAAPVKAGESVFAELALQNELEDIESLQAEVIAVARDHTGAQNQSTGV